MFDLGWSELLLIGIVALVVIGPKDLPHAFRMVGQWVAKARTMAREFQGHFDDLMRESEVEDMKREFRDMTKAPEGLEDELMAGHAPKNGAAKPAPGPETVVVPEPELPAETDKPLAAPPAP